MTIAQHLRERIAAEGAISAADYMAAANAHYYGTRDPLGAQGDFVTAPEISQMFGELVGLCLADAWRRAGRPAGMHYVELGPGRGTLAADALRAMRGAGLEPPVELVETSATLRERQRQALPGARWHREMATLPAPGPLMIVANEFFDALPVRQFVRADGGWRELVVRADGESFQRLPGALASYDYLPDHAEPGAVFERSEAGVEIVGALARRLAKQGGVALIIDYGPERRSLGDTLQAVAAHAFADPWQAPGTRDLTAHVDFETLGEAARAEGARVAGPVGQGAWLRALGLDLRAASLAKAAPERTEEIVLARERLSAPGQMGRLFKAMALVGRDWPAPEGFR